MFRMILFTVVIVFGTLNIIKSEAVPIWGKYLAIALSIVITGVVLLAGKKPKDGYNDKNFR